MFFKVCKSYLKLIGECRSISYDAMPAYAAIVFARYMMLSAENRIQIDDRTLVELFYNACNELPITWLEAFRILMEQRVVTMSGRVVLTENELESLLEEFMPALPQTLKCKMKKGA